MRRTRETTRQPDVPIAPPRLAEGLLAALEEVERTSRVGRRAAARAAASEPTERTRRRAHAVGQEAGTAPAVLPPPSRDEPAAAAAPGYTRDVVDAASPELVSGAEVARRLGVSRERVRQWAVNPRYGFPLSTGRSGPAKLWRWPEVERWAAEHRRRPPEEDR